MGVRGALRWPVNRLVGWIDDYPLSAAGALVAIGAFVVLLASVGVSLDDRNFVYEGVTLSAITDTVLSQPAYAVAVILGVALVLFYDG